MQTAKVNPRYQAWLNACGREANVTSGHYYSQWIQAQITEWAEQSGRTIEMDKERKDGWKFPALVSKEAHKQFDAWLQENYGCTHPHGRYSGSMPCTGDYICGACGKHLHPVTRRQYDVR